MRYRKTVLVVTAALLATTVSGFANARGGHGGGHRGGFGWGFGIAAAAVTLPFLAARSIYYSPYYASPYYPPYGYAPAYGYAPGYGAAYAQPAYPQPAYAQPAYAQQNQAAVQPQANNWYYCASSNGYYPYVRSCPEGWQTVSPTPPGM